MKKLSLTGHRFGRLTVIGSDPHSRDRMHTYWFCECECGNLISIRGSSLTSSTMTKSCGCITKENGKSSLTKHGYYYHSAYKSWIKMIYRCYNTNNKDYPDYGGRGITVCERWRDGPENFCEDMGERREGFTIDRIDNDQGYSPENCRWADAITQANNRRSNLFLATVHGVKTCAEVARLYGVDYKRLHHAITKKDMDLQEALQYCQ